MSKKPYFEIISQGVNEQLQREQIEINVNNGSGKVFLIKTDEGFIVDVYSYNEGKEELIDTLTIYDENLIDDLNNYED